MKTIVTTLLLVTFTMMSIPPASAQQNRLTARQVIERIQKHVGVPWTEPTVDTFKAGNPDMPVTGVAVAMMATLDVLRRAAEAGNNLVITHEPTFYDHFDKTEGMEKENDAVLAAKQALIKKHNLIVFRFHDYWHRRNPDGIQAGMIRALDWDRYRNRTEDRLFTVPATTLERLAADIRDRLKIRTLRVVGDPNLKVTKIGLAPGAPGFAYQRRMLQRDDVEALVIGEAQEWETIEYGTDAVAAGKPKALIILGHIPSEEAGMEECARWLRTFVSEVPVTFIKTPEPFWTPESRSNANKADIPKADIPVRVESGLLSGVPGSDPAVRIYKGVPFAAPPVGDLRWREPQPPAMWDGVRKADRFGASAMQPDLGAFGPWTKEFVFGNEVSEDCLYLNVWTDAKTADDNRPVLVYIHGGAFTGGSGEVAVYDGEELAKKGLVVVTINYRLGVFGFLAHPELTRESGHNASGNYGLLDQIAALKWVQRNIAAFGGDPDRVTIAGQSAGAASVHYLTASSLAKGLFQRAIAQSGSGVGSGSARPRADAEQDGVKFAETKGARSLADLRALPAKDLIAAGAGGGSTIRFGPVRDGWFLAEDVPAVFAQGRQNDVPTLTGLNADEGSASPNYGKAKADEFQTQVRQRYGDRAEAFLNLYPAGSDEQAGLSQKGSDRDRGVVSMALWAQNRAKTARTHAFLYYFDRAIPWPAHPEFGAFHTSEVPYVFHNLRRLDRPWEPADRQLADVMSSYWANFAATGDPNGNGLPRWPAFDPADIRFMRLAEKPAPLPLPEKARRELLTEILKDTK